MKIRVKLSNAETRSLSKLLRAFGCEDEAQLLENSDYAVKEDNIAMFSAYKSLDGEWSTTLRIKEGYACGFYDIISRRANTVKSVAIMLKGAYALAKDMLNGMHEEFVALSKKYDKKDDDGFYGKFTEKPEAEKEVA